MEKTIQILVKNNIERPPLLCGGSYYRIYLPEKVKLGPNQFKQVDLKFEIKATQSIPIQKLSDNILTKFAQPLEIYRELINRCDAGYKKAVINLQNRGHHCRNFIPKNTELARLYLFVEKEDIIYTKYEYCDNDNRQS